MKSDSITYLKLQHHHSTPETDDGQILLRTILSLKDCYARSRQSVLGFFQNKQALLYRKFTSATILGLQLYSYRLVADPETILRQKQTDDDLCETIFNEAIKRGDYGCLVAALEKAENSQIIEELLKLCNEERAKFPGDVDMICDIVEEETVPEVDFTVSKTDCWKVFCNTKAFITIITIEALLTLVATLLIVIIILRPEALQTHHHPAIYPDVPNLQLGSLKKIVASKDNAAHLSLNSEHDYHLILHHSDYGDWENFDVSIPENIHAITFRGSFTNRDIVLLLSKFQSLEKITFDMAQSSVCSFSSMIGQGKIKPVLRLHSLILIEVIGRLECTSIFKIFKREFFDAPKLEQVLFN